VKSRVGSAGFALGMTLQPKPSVKLIPNGTVQIEYGAVDVTDDVTGSSPTPTRSACSISDSG